MADFTIVAPVPFVIEGAEGATYELPRLNDLSAEQVARMGDMNDPKDAAERTRAIREFVLYLCPDLEREPISDMGYSRIFTALAEGSGIEVGES